jgi:hypothetical protein
MHETDGVGHPIALQGFEMAIDISQVTGKLISAEVIIPVLLVVANLVLIYCAFVAIRIALSLIRGDSETADFYGFQTLRSYDQRYQLHQRKLGYEKRYQREKLNSDYKNWKKFRGS